MTMPDTMPDPTPETEAKPQPFHDDPGLEYARNAAIACYQHLKELYDKYKMDDDDKCEYGECGCEIPCAEEIAWSEECYGVEARSGWESYENWEHLTPEDYVITLAGGGPAVRIFAEKMGNPHTFGRACIQYQNWGTPWTVLFGMDIEIDRGMLCEIAEMMVIF